MKTRPIPSSRWSLREQLDDLGLGGDVQCGDRFVADDQLRLGGQGAGDPDALALSAAELVRVALEVRRVQSDALQERAHPVPDASSSLSPAARSGSATDSPTERRGLSEATGSWKTIWRSRRKDRSSFSGSEPISRPP